MRRDASLTITLAFIVVPTHQRTYIVDCTVEITRGFNQTGVFFETFGHEYNILINIFEVIPAEQQASGGDPTRMHIR